MYSLFTLYYSGVSQALLYLGIMPTVFSIWLFTVTFLSAVLFVVGLCAGIARLLRPVRPPPLPAKSSNDDRWAA